MTKVCKKNKLNMHSVKAVLSVIENNIEKIKDKLSYTFEDDTLYLISVIEETQEENILSTKFIHDIQLILLNSGYSNNLLTFDEKNYYNIEGMKVKLNNPFNCLEGKRVIFFNNYLDINGLHCVSFINISDEVYDQYTNYKKEVYNKNNIMYGGGKKKRINVKVDDTKSPFDRMIKF